MQKIFKKGQIIIKQGDTVDRYLYIVQKGKLAVKRAVNDTVIDCGFLREGDIFGEISMILGTERAATIMAFSDEVVVEQLNKDGFYNKIKSNPEVAWRVLTNLAIKTEMLDEIQSQISDPKMLRMLLFGKK